MPLESAIPSALVSVESCRDLRARFAELPDPRRRRGIRHEAQVILVIVAAAVASGARSFTAIGEWAADAPQAVLEAIGVRWHPVRGVFVAPHEATLRRTVQAFDPDRLDRVIGGWLADQVAMGTALTAVAVDGRTVRGAYRPDGSQVHLLSAITHDAGTVLAQREVAAKTNEITELAPLLGDVQSAGVDLAGVIVTADALHTQRATADHLVREQNAHYLLTVKANQPRLLAACQTVLSGPAADFVPEHVAYSRGHGRTEQRTTRVKALTGHEGIDFPHAAQVFRVRRDTGGLDGQRTRKEIAYCITSAPGDHAGPADLSELVRGHRQIENRLCATRRLIAFPVEPGGIGGSFLGLMTYLEPKGEGDSSMSGNQRPCPGVWDGALGDPRDMAKAGLLEAQSPVDFRRFRRRRRVCRVWRR